MGFFTNLMKKRMTSGGAVSKRTSVASGSSQRIKSDWDQIEILLKGGGPSQLRQALITADKCLDNALCDVVKGESMGERLKNAKDKYDWTTYQKIWDAHKVRNSLVHEAGYEPPHHMITKSIADLKKGITSLGVSL